MYLIDWKNYYGWLGYEFKEGIKRDLITHDIFYLKQTFQWVQITVSIERSRIQVYIFLNEISYFKQKLKHYYYSFITKTHEGYTTES